MANKWKTLLTRMIDVIVFLGERGLFFRGNSQRIVDVHNSNFLGLLEVLAHYDPLLQEHVMKVKLSQQKQERLQAHYLSADSQNEFIDLCADYVRECILEELKKAKYHSIMVHATPDASHTEQTTFVLRYVLVGEVGEFAIKERFLIDIDCCKKTGAEIATMILHALKEFEIPLADCRGQGYDNAANMSGKYDDTQKHISDLNSLCLYSPCGCHSLNLCGADSAASSPYAITFFGMVATIYNLFSGSPKRWGILQEQIGSSLHGLSGTRWIARVNSVRPFAAHLPGLRLALEKLLLLSLTPKTRTEVNGAIAYVSSFTCIVMSAIWLKILVAIDQRNQVVQARDATIDVEVSNLKSLLNKLKDLRVKWSSIMNESKLVADAMQISPEFSSKRKRKRRAFFDEVRDPDDTTPTEQTETDGREEEEEFRRDVFFVIIDSVIAGLTNRYKAANNIDKLFSFLWQYLHLSEVEISEASDVFAGKYSDDVSQDQLKEEIIYLKSIHCDNFGDKALSPQDLQNKISEFNLYEIFGNICVALQIFCTLPVTVASALKFSLLNERSAE